MKKLLKIIKYIHHFTNHTVSDKDEADTLYNCMAYKNDPLRTLRVFEELEKRVELEMMKQKSDAEKICRAVNAKWKSESVKPYVYDENYDKPLSEIDVNYTLVKAI